MRTPRTHLSRRKIKFLADEKLRRAIVLGLRRPELSANFVKTLGVLGKQKWPSHPISPKTSATAAGVSGRARCSLRRRR